MCFFNFSRFQELTRVAGKPHKLTTRDPPGNVLISYYYFFFSFSLSFPPPPFSHPFHFIHHSLRHYSHYSRVGLWPFSLPPYSIPFPLSFVHLLLNPQQLYPQFPHSTSGKMAWHSHATAQTLLYRLFPVRVPRMA